MKMKRLLEPGFPDLWTLRGYWGACRFGQKDSDGDGISDQAEAYYEEHPEEWAERSDFLESQGFGPQDYDDYIGEDADGPETPDGAVSGGGDPDDPNVNEYGFGHDDWDDMSQDQQASIANSHGDYWHGQPPPDTSGNDDGDSGGGPPSNEDLANLFTDDYAGGGRDRPLGQHLGDPRIDPDHPEYEGGDDDDFDPTTGTAKPDAHRNLETFALSIGAVDDTPGMTVDQLYGAIDARNERVTQEAREYAEPLGWNPDAGDGQPQLTVWEFIEQHNEEVETKNRDLAESLGWDPDARGGLTPREFIRQHNERVMQELAESLGWDPDASGGRPELTPREFIERHDAVVDQEVRALAESLGWDPDARGGRPELTPREFIERHDALVGQKVRALAESLGWDPHARGGRPELTPREFIEQHNEEVEARARNWRESQRQLEALDELEPERLAQETLQRQQAAHFREDMFAELRSRGVSDEELADLTPGQLDAALATTADDLTREYQEWRESQRQLEALDELEPERLAHETRQRQQAAQFREDMFAELRSRGVSDEELADLTPGQLDAALAATADDLTREYQEWREAQRQLEALDELEPERLAQETLQRSELHGALQALFAHSGGDEIALDESEQAARAAAIWQRPGDWPQALRDAYQAGGWAGLRGTLTDDEIDARKAALRAELYGEGVTPADWWDDRTGDLALNLPELAEVGIDASPGNIDNLSAGELVKATRIASGERLPAIRLQDTWGREIVLDPMEPFDRESYEVAAISARGDAALDRQVREYAQGYGMYRLELPDSEMNARRLRLLEALSYAAPLPGIALGGKFVTFAARPFAKGVSKGVSLLARSGNKVPLTNVADDAAATVAKNAADFTRLLDAGKIGEARRVLLKNKTFRDWATGGGLDKADIQKAGMGHWLEEAVTLPPNVLQRALGNPAVNVAAQTLKSAVIGSGFSGTISTGIAVAPLGGQGWGEISGNEGKGIIDSLWQGGIGGATGGLSHRGINAWRRGVRKEELGRVGGYKLSAIEGASTDTGLALVPGFEDPTFGRITRDETLGIGLSTVADPALDGVKGVYRLLRHPRSLLPSTVSAGGLGSGTQKMHYSQVAAGDDVELREVTSLAEDGITPVATLQPEVNIREEIERRLKDHPQRIRPGDESGLGYDRIMSEGLDPISGLRLKEEILDALARGETDIRGVTSSGIPYRFTPPAAYRTGVFNPGAAAHLSPNASFALQARGDAADATYRSLSTNPNSVEEVLYYQPGAMALRYFDTSAMGNTGADAAREPLRETAAGFAGLPNVARRAIGLPPVNPAAIVLDADEVKRLTARNVVDGGPDELPEKAFHGAADTKGRDPLPREVFGRMGAEAEVVTSPGVDTPKRRVVMHILGGGPVAVGPEAHVPSFGEIWRTNVRGVSDLLPFGSRVGLRLDKSPEQLTIARDFFDAGGVSRKRDGTGKFEVDVVVGGVRYRIRTDDDPAALLAYVRAGRSGGVTNVIVRDTETGRVDQSTTPDGAAVETGATRALRDTGDPLTVRQELQASPRQNRALEGAGIRPDVGGLGVDRADLDRVDLDRVDAARADRVDADRVDAARADRVDADRVDTARADRVDADRVDTARADRVDADRVDAARADRVDADRVDAARADRVDVDRVDTARADRVDVDRVDTARADRVDADRVDAARADRVDADRVDAARADRADRVDAARADRVDADRVDNARADKHRLPRRKREEEPQEKPEKRRLPLRFPKTVRFRTVEDVEVDLETGHTKRTPVGNSPSESLKVVDYGELPHTDQHYAGRITDVLTDDQGHPYIAQNAEYKEQRPRRLPKSSELEKGKIKKLLEELGAQGKDKVASPRVGGGSRRGNKGSGRVSPAPGPGSTRRSGRRGMTALERTRLRHFAPR